MLKRAAAIAAVVVVAVIGTTGVAFADHGADDPAGHHSGAHHHGKHHHGEKHHHGHGQDDGPNHT